MIYSQCSAVFGHDATYIRRMTVEEYKNALKEQDSAVRGQSLPHNQQKQGVKQIEQSRLALSSRNPNVFFSSKYPVYDRLGRELCVAHQIQDMSIQQELRRLEEERCAGVDCRRSGVRLSAELPAGSDGATTRPGSLTETQPPSLAESRETAFSEEVARPVQPGHIERSSLEDIEVSATSNYPSVSASRASSRPVSARPSEFSIFRESGAVAAVGRDGFSNVASTIPMRSVAKEDGILLNHEMHDGMPRAISVPPSYGFIRCDDGSAEGQLPEWRCWSEKRCRSRSSGDRPGRVRFIREEDKHSVAEASLRNASPTLEPKYTRTRGASAEAPRHPSTPPPIPLCDPGRPHTENAASEETTRWTTLSRGSAAVRATKQLFRSTTHTVNASRMTSTLTYPQSITSNCYGLEARTILATKVEELVEHNVAVCTSVLPHHYTKGFYSEEDCVFSQHTPELRCGSIVQLGKEWYRLVCFYVVAEVYEAVRVDEPTNTTDRDCLCIQPVESSEAKAACGIPYPVSGEHADGAGMLSSKKGAETGQQFNSCKPLAGDSEVENTQPMAARLATDDEQLPARSGAETMPQSESTETSAPYPKSQQQFFVYRWRVANLSRGGDEARRAALGFSLCAPQMHVTGFRYGDGGGVTLVAVPTGHYAVPVSALPLSLRSYTTVLRMVLKALSSMVARRTVHGNIAALGELFLVQPVDEASRITEGNGALPQDGGGGVEAAESRPRDPFVLMFHWERWVDFGMFVDRNAGRTLAFDFEDSSAQPLVYYSKDILTSLQIFLEHPLAAQLTSEQYILLQKLVVLAAEPTPVANHLIQLKNLMLTLPIDTVAIHKSFENALAHLTEQ